MKSVKKILVAIVCIAFVNTNAQDYPFKVEVKGKGEPVLLFPGFTCTGEVWKEMVEEISKNHECHIFTLAGFGDVKPIEKPWLPKIKEGIEKYIVNTKLRNITVIGHSLGGTLGLWLVASDNSEIKKLIVVDALASAGALMIANYKSENIVYDNPYNKQLLEMDSDRFREMAKQMAVSMTSAKEKYQQLENWIVATDRKTYVYGYTDYLKLDLREDVGKINIPVTILAATEPYGKEMVKKSYTEQYKNLKEYNLLFADGSTHFVMYDKPNWFLSQIKTELAK